MHLWGRHRQVLHYRVIESNVRVGRERQDGAQRTLPSGRQPWTSKFGNTPNIFHSPLCIGISCPIHLNRRSFTLQCTYHVCATHQQKNNFRSVFMRRLGMFRNVSWLCQHSSYLSNFNSKVPQAIIKTCQIGPNQLVRIISVINLILSVNLLSNTNYQFTVNLQR